MLNCFFKRTTETPGKVCVLFLGLCGVWKDCVWLFPSSCEFRRKTKCLLFDNKRSKVLLNSTSCWLRFSPPVEDLTVSSNERLEHVLWRPCYISVCFWFCVSLAFCGHDAKAAKMSNHDLFCVDLHISVDSLQGLDTWSKFHLKITVIF